MFIAQHADRVVLWHVLSFRVISTVNISLKRSKISISDFITH